LPKSSSSNLISRFASDAGKKAGEFYTPRKVSELVARLAKPGAGMRICDPACGSGSLLIRAGEAAASPDHQLFGQEVNGSTHALARMNMFLHGEDNARIEWCNTLTGPALVEADRLMQFDRVVSNPPFSLDKWGAEEAATDPFRRFTPDLPPKTRGDYAFILHMLAIAKRGEGRVVCVAPHGVLFRGGAEGRIRESIIRKNLLDAVVGLPAQLFPSTSIPVCLLVFDRAREVGGDRAGCRDVIFVDASREFTPGKKQNQLEEMHVDKILATVEAREDLDRYAHVAIFAEIEANGFNLNISRYVDTFEPEPEIDITDVQREIDRLEIELSETRSRMRQYLMELGVNE
jgi:type I restriction enzyme M protein